MRLPKFLSVVFIITGLSLVYVYQETQIFCLAYLGQKKEAAFSDTFDKNSLLRYNIRKKASLVSLGSKFNDSGDFQMPDTYRLVKLASPEASGSSFKQYLSGKSNLFSRLFSVNKLAEANTINSK